MNASLSLCTEKPLTVGLGCRRGATVEQIDAAVHAALGGRPLGQVGAIATLDAKADEPGVRAFCARYRLPLRLFSAAQIASLPPPVRSCAQARAAFGVDGVCEPCALLASKQRHLIVRKTTLNGVAVAIASDSPDVTDTTE
jgi:cobalt-precorrin 5A hydrolase